MVQPAESAPPQESKKANGRVIVAVVVAILAIWFVIVNGQETEITFWIPTVNIPLWIALVVAIVLGAVIGLLIGRSRYKPSKK